MLDGLFASLYGDTATASMFLLSAAAALVLGGIIGLLKSKGYEVTQIQTEQVNK